MKYRKIKLKMPKNPFKNLGISDKDFKREILEDRQHRKKRYGNINIFR